jgi:hypothetical protein
MTKRMFIVLAILQTCILYKSVDGLKATVCEGGYLPLACPADSYIKVTSAMYGRLDNKTCPYGNISQTNCSETRLSLGALQALCNGQKSCDVDSLSYYFGEPCKGVYKYLTFEYSCLSCVNTYGDDATCEMWALLGECTGQNADWMGDYCSKACFKCEDVIDPGCYNVNNDANCTLRANKGECSDNPAFMGAYCKKACGQCDQPTNCANKANETVCKAKVEAQECSKNMSYMLSNCTKSCFNCTDTVKCANQNDMCDQWAMQGKCQTEAGKMMSVCTKSCLGCSADPVCSNDEGDSNCNYWASIGECSKNPVWMYRSCWKSCTNCSSPHVCDNVLDDALCEVWAGNGECSINPYYMLANCRLSCTRCKALEYGRPKCINSIFNDTLCTSWAQRGECTNNPGFMLKNCYRMCTSCYSPYRIGNDAVPGDELDVTEKATILLPFEFSQTAVLTQFSFFAVNTNPTYFQVWRKNGSYPYSLVYNKLVVPIAAYQAQDFKVQDCVIVNATDVVGMTTFSGPSPVAYTVSKDFSYFYFRESATVGGDEFSFVNAPVKFSLSAQFTPGTLC